MTNKTLVNPFKLATAQKRKAKILLYGDSGSGKTVNSLLGVPGPIAVIDTEGGTAIYADQPGIPRFHILETLSMADVKSALQFLKEGEHDFQTVVIDPLTILDTVIQHEAEKRGMVARDGTLSFRGWGYRKREITKLYTMLYNLPTHVIVTARERDIKKKVGEEFEVVGHTFQAHADTDYEFDIVIRLGEKDGQHFGIIEKVRALYQNLIPRTVELSLDEQRVDNPPDDAKYPVYGCVFDWLKPVVELLGKGKKAAAERQDAEEAAEKDVLASQDAEAALEKKKAGFLKTVKKLGLDRNDAVAHCKKATKSDSLTPDNFDAWVKAAEALAKAAEKAPEKPAEASENEGGPEPTNGKNAPEKGSQEELPPWEIDAAKAAESG